MQHVQHYILYLHINRYLSVHLSAHLPLSIFIALQFLLLLFLPFFFLSGQNTFHYILLLFTAPIVKLNSVT